MWRVYSYLMPGDERVGRAAVTETLRKLVHDVNRSGTGVAVK